VCARVNGAELKGRCNPAYLYFAKQRGAHGAACRSRYRGLVAGLHRAGAERRALRWCV